MSISKPDAAKTAAERLNKEAGGENPPAATVSGEQPRKRGRPKGSKNKSSTGDAFILERSKEDIESGKQLCAFLFATVWGIAAPMLKRKDVTDEQALMIGAALDPVLVKYLPGMSGFVLEINLLVAIAAVWQATEIPDEKHEVPKTDYTVENAPTYGVPGTEGLYRGAP